MMLDPNNPIPLHVQLKEILRKDIKNEIYSDKIPSERELMDKYSVSRTTVREAVSALVREGVLEKIHGKGTFINYSNSVNEWLGNLSSFSETIERMGMKPGAKLLFKRIESDPEIADTLGVSEYYTIVRLRFANDKPIAIERHYYPVEIGLKLAQYDLNEITIYTTLEANGIILHEAEQKITASLPIREDAELLGISPLKSVLTAERLILDSKGNPLEYYYAVYRSDKYAFSIKLLRKNPKVLFG